MRSAKHQVSRRSFQRLGGGAAAATIVLARFGMGKKLPANNLAVPDRLRALRHIPGLGSSAAGRRVRRPVQRQGRRKATPPTIVARWRNDVDLVAIATHPGWQCPDLDRHGSRQGRACEKPMTRFIAEIAG